MTDLAYYVQSATARVEGMVTVTAVIHSSFDKKKSFRVILFQQDKDDRELVPLRKVVDVLSGYPQPVHFNTWAHTCHFQITVPHSEEVEGMVTFYEITLPRRDA